MCGYLYFLRFCYIVCKRARKVSVFSLNIDTTNGRDMKGVVVGVVTFFGGVRKVRTKCWLTIVNWTKWGFDQGTQKCKNFWKWGVRRPLLRFVGMSWWSIGKGVHTFWRGEINNLWSWWRLAMVSGEEYESEAIFD